MSNLPNNKEKTIYQLDLHELLMVEDNPSSPFCISVMRVPNGWIYKSINKVTGIMAAVFVPYSEFYK